MSLLLSRMSFLKGRIQSQNNLKKILLVMKLTIFLILVAFFQVRAEGYAQNVTLSANKIPMEKLFSQVKKQTGYIFFYDKALLKNARTVSIHVKNAPLDKVLDISFRDQPLSYKIIGQTIVVRGRPFIHSSIAAKKDEILVEKTFERVIKGNVVDEEGNVMQGISVSIKGTKRGTTTDRNGNFTLNVDEGKVVIVLSGANVEPKEIEIKNNTSNLKKIVLQYKMTPANEIIVTGYQELKETRMTGSVDVIRAKDIANKGYTSIGQILKGQLPGVATMNLSGRPGESAQIRIRGINSLNGNSDPMWIVDGMPLQGDVPKVSMGGTEFQETVLTSGIGNISPDDIESITVLKDAAATAIYGARAANGVIVITTKRGTEGTSRISIRGQVGFTEAPSNRLKMMNTNQKIDFEKGIYEDFPGLDLGGRVYQAKKKMDNGVLTKEDFEKELNRLKGINTNWFEKVFRRGMTQNYGTTLSGGNEKTQYYGSLSYLTERGVVPNNRYGNISGNLKLTHNFNDRLRINLDIGITSRDDRSTASSVNPLDYATFANPYERPFDENGQYVFDRSYFSDISAIEPGYVYDFNILKDLEENTQTSKYSSNRTALKLEYRIIKGLMFSSMGTFSNTTTNSRRELVPGSYSSKSNSWIVGIYPENEVPQYLNNGQLTETSSRAQSWNFRNQFEFARGFSDGKHYINALLGQEVSSTMTYGTMNMMPEWNPTYGVATFPDLNGLQINSSLNLTKLGSHSENQDRSVSFFSTGTYSFKDKYVFSGSARLDGVDIIGTANRFSPLWNLSGRWNLHNEDFIENLSFIDLLSVRMSYGFTASIDRSVLPFSIMTKSGNLVYDGIKIFDRFTPASPAVKWQKKEDRNIGVDVSMFRHRVNLTVNYYINDVRDLIGTDRVAASTGRTSVSSNVASLRNKGVEINLRTVNIKSENFSWITSFNVAIDHGVVTKTEYKKLEDYSVNTNSTFEDIYNLYIQGEPIKAYYGFRFAGVDPLDGGSLAYIDGVDSKGNPLGSLNNDGRYVYNMDLGQNFTAENLNAARDYLGLSYPPITGGMGTQLNFKQFSISGQFTFMTGHLLRSYLSYSQGTVYNSARNVLDVEANRWRIPGDVTSIPKYDVGRTEYLYQLFDFRFEKGDYLKLNNLSIGYNLSHQITKKMGFQQARINANMLNVFTLTNYRGIDPETMGAFGYPSAKSYNLSISVTL